MLCASGNVLTLLTLLLHRSLPPLQVKGWATNISYDWHMLDAACGMELDYVPGDDVLHLDVNLFSNKDYSLAWLLLIPAVNYLRDLFRRRVP